MVWKEKISSAGRQDRIDPFYAEKEYLTKRMKELESLDRFTNLMMSSFNIKDVIDIVLGYVLKVLPIDMASIVFLFEDHIFIKSDSKRKLNKWVIDDIKNRMIESIRKEENYKHLIDKILFEWREEKTSSDKITLLPSAKKTEITFPLISHRKELGMMSCLCFSERRLRRRERQYLSRITKKSAICLENVCRQMLLEKQARIDSLTRVYNHRVFYEIIEREFNRYKRYKNFLSLIMLDVDNFKLINDTFGHQVGDRVLKELTSLLRECIRETDTLARYGGDEFAVILPETKKEDTCILAERMRKKIDSHRFTHAGKTFGASISLGISWLSSLDVKNKDDLICLADEALYTAKMRGKNRICLAKTRMDRLKIS